MLGICLIVISIQFEAVREKHAFIKLPGITRYLLILAMLQGIFQRISSQTADKIIDDLDQSGFENLRCIITEDTCYVSIENYTYRWDVMAISQALDIIASDLDGAFEINLLLLDNTVPQKLINVSTSDWKDFSSEIMDAERFTDKISIAYRTGGASAKLRGAEVINPGIRKFDLVIYPQLYFENTLLNKFYETQVNIAPALKFSLWKGNRFTGQVIFPIQNNLGYEGDHIRPGILTISQEFRLSDNLFSTISAGNFSNSLYGISASVRLYVFNGRCNLEMTDGLIGSSHFIDREWVHSRLDRFTCSLAISWFWSRFNLELKAGGARYINEDCGIFATCLRHFNETAVGLYVQAGKSGNNGGFFFSIPIPCKRRPDRRFFRISLPPQYGFTYNAGTEYYYGQTLRTEFNSIYEDRFTWDKSLKNMIINLKNY
jgi:hypothetical protein